MYLALAFTVPSFQVGIRTSRLLSGFVLIGNADAVLDAFTDARHVSLDRYRFQKVVDGLGSKEEWDGSDSEYVVDDHRFALLMFVVTLAREVKEVERRVLLREEFNRAGLKEQIVVSPPATPSKDPHSQLTSYCLARPNVRLFATSSLRTGSSTLSRRGRTTPRTMKTPSCSSSARSWRNGWWKGPMARSSRWGTACGSYLPP
jgi:hypothetical protein